MTNTIKKTAMERPAGFDTEQKESRYHIMTSCDDKLAPYVAVLMVSVAKALKEETVSFYLFHSRVDRRNIEMLKALGGEFENMRFEEIVVPEPERYDALAKHGSGWSGEAYYSLCAHLLLPENVHRVMYLDAGDTMVLGDIKPYYDYDFQGNSLIVTGSSYKIENGEVIPYSGQDLGDWNNKLPYILRGLFNSGSYLINLDKLRQNGFTLYDYEYLAQKLAEILGEENKKIYWGDQGLLSAAFVGDIRYYGFPEIRNIWYMPYNFCVWYFDRMQEKPEYGQSVVHFAGTPYKPWGGSIPNLHRTVSGRRKASSVKRTEAGTGRVFLSVA